MEDSNKEFNFYYGLNEQLLKNEFINNNQKEFQKFCKQKYKEFVKKVLQSLNKS